MFHVYTVRRLHFPRGRCARTGPRVPCLSPWPGSARFGRRCFQLFPVLQGPPGLCSRNKNTSAGLRTGARTCWRISEGTPTRLTMQPAGKVAAPPCGVPDLGCPCWTAGPGSEWGARSPGALLSSLGVGQGAPQILKQCSKAAPPGWTTALADVQPHVLMGTASPAPGSVLATEESVLGGGEMSG